MENKFTITSSLILGGALLGAFLLASMPVFAYDQDNTHPALTDEIVDFYNLNFPKNKITYEQKQWLMNGSMDEDSGERPLFHFYDPVYNKGLISLSSKDWALKQGAQTAYYNSQLTGFAAISDEDSANDFSYSRALEDYATGNTKRAFLAFGHVLHLLEDAGVPDHTRNDPHPPFFDEAFHQASPYEHEMAKWNPQNFQIAQSLFWRREKPVSLENMEGYFDRVANYSNSNFFSKDTITNKMYSSPDTKQLGRIFINGELRLFIVHKDSSNQTFPLAIVSIREDKESKIDIVSDEIGTHILDGYWNRLSKEIVLNGAGALNLFLKEAEKEKQEYLARANQKQPSFWAEIGNLLGFKDSSEDLNLSTGGNSDENNPLKSSKSDSEEKALPAVTQETNPDTNDGDKTGDTKILPSLSPILSPKPTVSPSVSPKPSPTPSLLPTPLPAAEKININTASKEELLTLKGIGSVKSEAIIQYRQINGQFQKIEDIMNVTGIGQATFNDIKDQITVGNITPPPAGGPTPTPVANSGSGSGGNQSPAPTGDTSSSGGGDTTLGTVVINEIAWMGTATSSNDEWMELYNTTNQTVDLTGWTLKSLTGTSPDPQITLSGSIAPYSFYLLERTDDDTVSDTLANKIYTGSLLDTGETLELRDASNLLQDKVQGESGWYSGDKNSKSSMERINPKQSGSNSSNWGTNNGTTKNGIDAGGNPINGTPRSRNSGYISLKPSSITSFAVNFNSTLGASWLASQDLDTLPASLSYDLRYSSTSFSGGGSVWDLAARLASSSLPAVAENGASQSASFDIVHGYGQTMYFAVKTKLKNCGTGDCEYSDISNIAQVSFPSAVDNKSWAMPGKNQHHTSFADSMLGPGSTATISWEYDVGSGYSISQPMVSADGDIFFGAAKGSDKKLVKLNKNGVKQWEYSTNVSIGAPVVISDEKVYFGRIGAGGILAFTALNSNGSKSWDYNDAGKITEFTVSEKGEPYFAFSSGGPDKLVALNTNGSVKTTISGSGLGGFAPVVLSDGTIIAASKVSGNQFFTSYSSSGTQNWQLSYTGANGNTPADPSYDQDSSTTYSAASYYLFDIPSGGSAINTTSLSSSGLGLITTAISISPSKLFVGMDKNISVPASGSELIAIDKSSKTISWRYGVDSSVNKQIAVDSGGNSYFSTENGKVYSLDSSGSLRWSRDFGSDTTIYPVFSEHGLVDSYDSRVVFIK